MAVFSFVLLLLMGLPTDFLTQPFAPRGPADLARGLLLGGSVWGIGFVFKGILKLIENEVDKEGGAAAKALRIPLAFLAMITYGFGVIYVFGYLGLMAVFVYYRCL